MKQKLLLGVILLSIIGVIISGYLVRVHYTNSSVCDFDDKFSCSSVSQSLFAEIKGIPVAIFGVLVYSILGIVAFGKYKINKKIDVNKNGIIYLATHHKLLLLIAISALLFSFYLTYAELFILKVKCILCLVSQGTILGIALIGYKYHQLEKKSLEK
ncbi:vitamin K epoxide reductase family protein [Candidatus Woesearchaeota archaeon]|nr:vitamin K epoxide reductase family protein [Candidatus Woesearchaeota archaeon]